MHGFVLTMDAMIAAMTAMAMAYVLMSLMASSSVSNFGEQQLSAAGNDIISTMQSNGTLNWYVGSNPALVQSDMSSRLSKLPSSYCVNFTIKAYRVSDFYLQYQYNVSAQSSECSIGKSIVTIRRPFANYGTSHFGLAEMTLWLKGG